MKKFILYIIMACSCLPLQANTIELIESELGLSQYQFANLIYRRFYFIRRLNRFMHVLLQVHTKESIERMRLMSHGKKIKPLFIEWEKFRSFKALEDQVLVESFTQDILLVSASLASIPESIPESNNITTPSTSININIPAYKALDKIDTYLDHFLNENPEYTDCGYNEENELFIKYAPLDGNDLSTIDRSDIQAFVQADTVIQRFYFIERLKKMAFMACEINKCGILPHNNLYEFDKTLFYHSRITHCVKEIKQSRSLNAFHNLWQEYQQYRFVEHDQFTHEFVMLSALIYEQIIQHYGLIKRNNPSLNKFLEACNNLEDITLHEMLDILDEVIRDFEPTFEEKQAQLNNGSNFTAIPSWSLLAIPLVTIPLLYGITK